MTTHTTKSTDGLPNNVEFAYSLMSTIKNGGCSRHHIVAGIEENFRIQQIGPTKSIYMKVSNILTRLKNEGFVTNIARDHWILTSSGDEALSQGRCSEAFRFLWPSKLDWIKYNQENVVPNHQRIKIPLPSDTQIYLERHLRDIISTSNVLSKITKSFGVTTKQLKSIKPEYHVPGDQNRIDIFAVGESETYICAELKLAKGYDSHLGKLQGYMGRIMMEFETNNVVGILLANDITEGAKFASMGAKDITLLQYKLIREHNAPHLVISKVNFHLPLPDGTKQES